MAQPTVNSRPATWAGTSGPILYKFTSTNYANAGYRMEVEIWDATAAAKIADAKYYANSSGALTVDVSAFLKSNLSLNLDADLTSGTVYEDVNWMKYYIKYQEVWTASSETQVNDSGNPRWAIYGGLQLGVINDFTDYVDPEILFLMLMDQGTAIKNYPFLVGFKATDGSMLIKNRYEDNTIIETTYEEITVDDIAIIKVKETGDADRVDLALHPYTDVEVRPGTSFIDSSLTAFTKGATTLSVSSSSSDSWNGYRAITGLSINDFTDLEFQITISGTWTLGPSDEIIFVAVLSDASNVDRYIEASLNKVNGVQTVTLRDSDPAFSGTVGTNRLYIELGLTGISSGTISISILLPEDGLSFGTALSETKTIKILPECSNTIVLSWRNSLGGWECYPFTYNQEYTFDYGNGKKAKRLTLFANNLTLNQWEAIQGLNTIGERYRTPINEMTTSLNRTSAQIGQSVYVLNSDGTKTGVVVIPQSNTTFTKQKKHQATVTIEYPEVFLQ